MEIDSTNSWLAAQARAGAPEGLVALADYQSAGRGRLGRPWESPLGASLLCSILLRPTSAEQAQLAVAAVALSARAALEELTGLRPSLKWPNDLLVHGAKLAGLLAELVTDPSGTAVVVGLGVNLTHAGPVQVQATSVLAETGARIAPAALLDTTLRQVAFRRALLETAEGRDELMREYTSSLETLGARVRVERHEDTFVGVARAVDEAGHLVVDVDGVDVIVSAGDVVHVRLDRGEET